MKMAPVSFTGTCFLLPNFQLFTQQFSLIFRVIKSIWPLGRLTFLQVWNATRCSQTSDSSRVTLYSFLFLLFLYFVCCPFWLEHDGVMMGGRLNIILKKEKVYLLFICFSFHIDSLLTRWLQASCKLSRHCCCCCLIALL